MAIRTPDQRLRVFVSSSLGELAEERRAVSRAISALRLTPVLFELGARPHAPQDVYRAYLAQSDVFIGVYWQRYGQIAPGTAISGLEEEFELSRELPRLVYLKTPAPDREPRLTDLLVRIKQRAAYRTFRTPRELARLARQDLATLLSERFAAARPPSAAAAQPSSTSWRGPHALPVESTSLVGRDRAIDEVAKLVEHPGVRLVTLTGPGGIGKTRLAVAVGERLRDRFSAGTVFVPLEAVTRRELVLPSIARAVGADLPGRGLPLEALVDQLGEGRWLLILDNLEQVVDAAGDLGELLARCPGVALLATTRTVLGLRVEREYPVPTLPLPGDPTGLRLDEIASLPAVALFVDRARAVRYDFALTEGNASAVVEICRRLDGLPLAIELAAARTRVLDPPALVGRLARSLDALGTGTVDMPERQHTLRATVEWSVGQLEEAERSLLEVMAVFVNGWTIEAAAHVAGLDEDRALHLTEALARHSLIQPDPERGTRSRMLETVREFVAERLAARPDVSDIQRRHAYHYRALAEQANRPLRTTGLVAWLEHLQAETGNLAAAVRWYLAHDPAPLPHLCWVLWPFWFLGDHIDEVRTWLAQLLPTADSLDAQTRAELLWTVLASAIEAGDDAVALDAGERLEALLDTIQDPFLSAVSQIANAWASLIVDDVDGALQRLSLSLNELRGQDEPFWTALTVGSLGLLEIAAGRYRAALSHLSESRNLAEQFDNAWVASWSRAVLGTLAVIQGRRDDARALLEESLDLSLGAHSARTVTLSLDGFARLALVEGQPERAALLAGAVEGLRRRAGLRAWPMLRQREAELIGQLCLTLGADRFDQAFAAGCRLSQREAVALARTWR